MMVSSDVPPHGLQLVIDFVNTLDVERGDDAIAGASDLGVWLRERGLLSAGAGTGAGEPSAGEHAGALA
ncbi:MAG: ABATE domain-containing protein, partial [Solirubrobacteraceae bacterium]